MNIIVTHFSPDLDAICAIWLVKRFFPGFSKSDVKFVPAGKTLDNKDPDAEKSVIHVDTGFGKFDHHQTAVQTCACIKVYQYANGQNWLTANETKVLARIVAQVNEIDHFQQVFRPRADADYFDFGLEAIIDGLKLLHSFADRKIIETGLVCLDAVFQQFTNKIWAEKLILEEGIRFKSKFGKAIAFSTTNDEAIVLSQKKGFRLVVRLDPKKNYVRIKSWPIPEIDLTPIYQKLREKDPDATWFLHVSKHMILNGSTKNPEMKPTKLSLEEIIEIIKKIKL